jgi:hypothetical protein
MKGFIQVQNGTAKVEQLGAPAETPCCNLGSWMTSIEYVRSIFAELSANATVSVIEGVMGISMDLHPSD